MKEVLDPHRDRKSLWSMHPELHDKVLQRLDEFNLHYVFHSDDRREAYLLNEWKAKIPARFTCHNEICGHRWTRQSVGILMRRYLGQKYNARVYWQACMRCQQATHPIFDNEYANGYPDLLAYTIKVWSGMPARRPRPLHTNVHGPHWRYLCSWCKAGRCTIIPH